MILHVESTTNCYGDPEPFSFVLGGRCLEVREIIDRWLSPEYGYFKIRASDENIYILRYDQPHRQWEMTLFQAARPLDGASP